jgi:hypothetical protein
MSKRVRQIISLVLALLFLISFVAGTITITVRAEEDTTSEERRFAEGHSQMQSSDEHAGAFDANEGEDEFGVFANHVTTHNSEDGENEWKRPNTYFSVMQRMLFPGYINNVSDGYRRTPRPMGYNHDTGRICGTIANFPQDAMNHNCNLPNLSAEIVQAFAGTFVPTGVLNAERASARPPFSLGLPVSIGYPDPRVTYTVLNPAPVPVPIDPADRLSQSFTGLELLGYNLRFSTYAGEWDRIQIQIGARLFANMGFIDTLAMAGTAIWNGLSAGFSHIVENFSWRGLFSGRLFRVREVVISAAFHSILDTSDYEASLAWRRTSQWHDTLYGIHIVTDLEMMMAGQAAMMAVWNEFFGNAICGDMADIYGESEDVIEGSGSDYNQTMPSLNFWQRLILRIVGRTEACWTLILNLNNDAGAAPAPIWIPGHSAWETADSITRRLAHFSGNCCDGHEWTDEEGNTHTYYCNDLTPLQKRDCGWCEGYAPPREYHPEWFRLTNNGTRPNVLQAHERSWEWGGSIGESFFPPGDVSTRPSWTKSPDNETGKRGFDPSVDWANAQTRFSEVCHTIIDAAEEDWDDAKEVGLKPNELPSTSVLWPEFVACYNEQLAIWSGPHVQASNWQIQAISLISTMYASAWRELNQQREDPYQNVGRYVCNHGGTVIPGLTMYFGAEHGANDNGVDGRYVFDETGNDNQQSYSPARCPIRPSISGAMFGSGFNNPDHQGPVQGLDSRRTLVENDGIRMLTKGAPGGAGIAPLWQTISRFMAIITNIVLGFAFTPLLTNLGITQIIEVLLGNLRDSLFFPLSIIASIFAGLYLTISILKQFSTKGILVRIGLMFIVFILGTAFLMRPDQVVRFVDEFPVAIDNAIADMVLNTDASEICGATGNNSGIRAAQCNVWEFMIFHPWVHGQWGTGYNALWSSDLFAQNVPASGRRFENTNNELVIPSQGFLVDTGGPGGIGINNNWAFYQAYVMSAGTITTDIQDARGSMDNNIYRVVDLQAGPNCGSEETMSSCQSDGRQLLAWAGRDTSNGSRAWITFLAAIYSVVGGILIISMSIMKIQYSFLFAIYLIFFPIMLLLGMTILGHAKLKSYICNLISLLLKRAAITMILVIMLRIINAILSTTTNNTGFFQIFLIILITLIIFWSYRKPLLKSINIDPANAMGGTGLMSGDPEEMWDSVKSLTPKVVQQQAARIKSKVAGGAAGLAAGTLVAAKLKASKSSLLKPPPGMYKPENYKPPVMPKARDIIAQTASAGWGRSKRMIDRTQERQGLAGSRRFGRAISAVNDASIREIMGKMPRGKGGNRRDEAQLNLSTRRGRRQANIRASRDAMFKAVTGMDTKQGMARVGHFEKALMKNPNLQRAIRNSAKSGKRGGKNAGTLKGKHIQQAAIKMTRIETKYTKSEARKTFKRLRKEKSTERSNIRRDSRSIVASQARTHVTLAFMKATGSGNSIQANQLRNQLVTNSEALHNNSNNMIKVSDGYRTVRNTGDKLAGLAIVDRMAIGASHLSDGRALIASKVSAKISRMKGDLGGELEAENLKRETSELNDSRRERARKRIQNRQDQAAYRLEERSQIGRSQAEAEQNARDSITKVVKEESDYILKY